MMELRLRVEVNGMYFSGGAIAEVTEQQLQCFEPLKTNDDPMMCIADGGVMASSEAVNIVMRTRKDAADVIAKELAALIVHEMKKNDTHNGYNKDTA